MTNFDTNYFVYLGNQPFVDEPAILKLFPPRIFAIIIPATALVGVISIVGCFIGIVLLKEARKNKTK